MNRKIGQIEVTQDAYFKATFVCPKCGSSLFGTADLGKEEIKRICHGTKRDGSFCTFTWSIDEDHKYFYLPLEFVVNEHGKI